MTCTASPLYVAELIATGVIEGDKDSIYSLEGTEAHDWATQVLIGLIGLEKVPEDFRPHVAEYVRVCEECEEGSEKASMRLVESKVPLFYAPDETGTMDYGFLKCDKKAQPVELHIRDLKYGKGVPVDAEENTQLAIYAWSFIQDLASWWGSLPGHLPVSIGIHQPRYHGDDALKLWDTTVNDLGEFCEAITATAKRISSVESFHELEFVPSADACQFCPAKGVCRARLDHAFEFFPADINGIELMSNLDLPEVETVPREQLVALWSRRKEISRWIDNAEEYLLALLNAGKSVPGIKLVTGREGNRAWKDEDMTAKVLKKYLPEDNLWKKTLISPAVAEKELKGAAVAKPVIESQMVKLTERPAGKPVLALESDGREEVKPAVALFELITDEEEKV
jgi:hypothetical protein